MRAFCILMLLIWCICPVFSTYSTNLYLILLWKWLKGGSFTCIHATLFSFSLSLSPPLFFLDFFFWGGGGGGDRPPQPPPPPLVTRLRHASQSLSIGSFRRVTQRASCATQEATNGTAFFGPLCLTSAFANERRSSTVYCRVHVMHERIPSPGKVSDWLILQLRRTSRTTLISAITVLDSRGRMVSSS